MEEQWLAYLRENNPELCEQAESSVKWAAEWRDKELTAANARVDELEKDNARQKRLATISRLCKNVQSCRAEKAEQRAEQAEAQCAKYHVALLKIKTWCGEPMHEDGVELQYVLNIAKAALEGAP